MTSTKSPKPEIIFFGNGPLAEHSLAVLQSHFHILFHARTKEDLQSAQKIKLQHPHAYAILASFGIIIPADYLKVYEPTGITNLHPSLLPKYRGPTAIETAILDGETDFGYSIIKLTPRCDAGPIYYQELIKDIPLNKALIYQTLATAGAKWLVQNLTNLPTPTPQDDQQATYTQKFDKSLSPLDSTKHSAATLLRQVIAFQDFPKSKYHFFNQECIILKAHISSTPTPLSILCQDGQYLAIDELQPANRRPMSEKSFLNGYAPRKSS